MGRNYPEAEAEYQHLVENPQVFFDKLHHFHSSFHSNSHFTTPSFCGTTLDLHRLFVEVTSRGGLDQVIRDRKWEDVVSAFKFGISCTGGSFILRKHYLSLLYHFEQAYFLRKKEAAIPITDAVSPTPVPASPVRSTQSVDEDNSLTRPLAASLQIQPGISLVGVIDEKFDNGYVVSVNLGSEKLKGILYHIPDKPQPPRSSQPGIPQRRKRKKTQLSLLDPSTVNPSSKNSNFLSENYASVKPFVQGQEDWALVE